MNVDKLDEPCGINFTFRDFTDCSETFKSSDVINIPKEDKTFIALVDLSKNIIDPLIRKFGLLELTYGFASPELTKLIKNRIAPTLDQHSSYERNSKGNLICERGGAAADFVIKKAGSLIVAKWIIENCLFDRLYFWKNSKPLHVSYGPQLKRSVVVMTPSKTNRLRYIPRVYKEEDFLLLKA
jgi:hypothetical protein